MPCAVSAVRGASLQGTLLVRLIKADHLAARDVTTSDPYCTFSLNKGKSRTSWVIQNTLEPVWNQKFEWANVRLPPRTLEPNP